MMIMHSSPTSHTLTHLLIPLSLDRVPAPSECLRTTPICLQCPQFEFLLPDEQVVRWWTHSGTRSDTVCLLNASLASHGPLDGY